MGLPITVPKSENDIEEAIKGTFCFYSGKAFDAINKIAVRIAEFSPPPPAKRLVTVVPIELYYEGWLYELPVFRTVDILDPTKTTATTTTTTTTNNTRFIDNCGRVYKDFTDFRLNNKVSFSILLMYARWAIYVYVSVINNCVLASTRSDVLSGGRPSEADRVESAACRVRVLDDAGESRQRQDTQVHGRGRAGRGHWCRRRLVLHGRSGHSDYCRWFGSMGAKPFHFASMCKKTLIFNTLYLYIIYIDSWMIFSAECNHFKRFEPHK